jgi:spore coat protein U-like protein
MSKILRIAAAGVAMASLGVASAATAATTDSADVTATILTALSVDVDATADTLNFGTIADGGIAANQTIVVGTDGVRGACPANLICGGTTAAPLFHVTGLAANVVDVSLVNSAETLSYDTVANGGAAPVGFNSTMTVNNFQTDAVNGAVTNQLLLDGAGDASFSVGGSLVVQPNMAAGIYTGTLTVSVAYN